MRRADNRLDREHVAEEIEDLGKSERDAVRSQKSAGSSSNLLKLQYSPAIDPRYDWMASIVDARRLLADKITATLRADVERTLPQLYSDGCELAAIGLRKFGENPENLPPLAPIRCSKSGNAAGTRAGDPIQLTRPSTPAGHSEERSDDAISCRPCSAERLPRQPCGLLAMTARCLSRPAGRRALRGVTKRFASGLRRWPGSTCRWRAASS